MDSNSGAIDVNSLPPSIQDTGNEAIRGRRQSSSGRPRTRGRGGGSRGHQRRISDRSNAVVSADTSMNLLGASSQSVSQTTKQQGSGRGQRNHERTQGSNRGRGRGRGQGTSGGSTNQHYRGGPPTTTTPTRSPALAYNHSPTYHQSTNTTTRYMTPQAPQAPNFSPKYQNFNPHAGYSTSTSQLINAGLNTETAPINDSSAGVTEPFGAMHLNMNNHPAQTLQPAWNTIPGFRSNVSIQQRSNQQGQSLSDNSTPLISPIDPESNPFQDAGEQRYSMEPLTYLYSLGSRESSPRLGQPNTGLIEPVTLTLGSFFGLLYMSALESLVISSSKLEEWHYSTSDLTIGELKDKRRCIGCAKPWGKVRIGQQSAFKRAAVEEHRQAELAKDIAKQEMEDNAKNGIIQTVEDATAKAKQMMKKPPVLRCKYHPGAVIKSQRSHDPSKPMLPDQLGYERVWSCCNKPTSSEPCSGSELHRPHDQELAELVAQWQTHPTPPIPLSGTDNHRTAVALDCEMGVSKSGDSELIRVTLMDYFTGEALIDRLVYPTVPMLHLNTRFSGVTWDMLNKASSKRRCIRGRDAAREEVWKYVGPQTIVIAHSGYNDLTSLRWRHNRILDTYVIAETYQRILRKKELEKAALEKSVASMIKEEDDEPGKAQSEEEDLTNGKGTPQHLGTRNTNTVNKEGKEETKTLPKVRKIKGTGPCSLKTLSKLRLDRDIQAAKKGHDSAEDALAARDLAHWLVKNILEEKDNEEIDAWLDANT